MRKRLTSWVKKKLGREKDKKSVKYAGPLSSSSKGITVKSMKKQSAFMQGFSNKLAALRTSKIKPISGVPPIKKAPVKEPPKTPSVKPVKPAEPAKVDTIKAPLKIKPIKPI